MNILKWSELFNKLWVKVVVQVFLTFLLYLVYGVLRYALPKKYRIKDKQIKSFLIKFNTIVGCSPNKDDSPFGLVNKTLTLFNMFHDNISEDPGTYIQDYADKNDLELKFDSAFVRYFWHIIAPKAKGIKIIEQIESKKAFVEYTFEENEKIYIMKFVGATDAHAVSFSDYFAQTKGFKYKKLIKKILERYDNKLYVTKSPESIVVFGPLSPHIQTEEYISIPLIDLLEQEIKSFREKGVSRSYIFCGAPGAGKSVMSLELSRRISNSVVKLDSNVFSSLGGNVTKMLIENIGSDVIIVDDIDRLRTDDVSFLLYGLESFKKFENCPVMLATLNNINSLDSAMLRPGRFDEIVEFLPMTEEERLVFINKLIENLEFSLEKENIEKLVKATEDLSQAYIKEYCLQLQNGLTIDKVIEKIENRKKYI